MKPKYLFWRGLTVTLAALLIISILLTNLAIANEGSINTVLKIGASVSSGNGNMVYPSDFGELSDESLKLLIAAEDAYNKRTMEEGAVLVTNNGALPLDSGEKKVTLFGRAVADPVYRSSSAGPNLNPTRLISLKDALENAGFSINETLYDAYASSTTARTKGTNASIGEEKISFYTDSIKSTFPSYSDVAIVMFARDGGEGNDLNVFDSDGVAQLSLHKNEKDLLKMINESGIFKKTIVLINSGYAMELGWLEDPQYGVDACLWIGGPGLTGFTGVPSLLTGEANPSGRFNDTYAASSVSAPSMRNFGDFTFTNAQGETKKSKYIIEAESIYIGYKYYETRYQDEVLGINNATGTAGVFASKNGWSYADEMDFPYGYGLSYTTFSQKLDELTWDRDSKTVTASVTVTNTGSVAGKSVVELYVQLPYTDYDVENLVEKSAIQLLDFEKTDLLEPGASQTVNFTVDEYLFATYDENKAKTYIYDDGDYYFAIGDDAHDALNNVLAARGVSGMFDRNGNPVPGNSDNCVKVTLSAFDDTTYRTSQYTGNEVTNQFDDVDYNYFFPGTVTYLTRSDWNTYPKSYSSLEVNDEMMKLMDDDSYTAPETEYKFSDFTMEADNGINFIDMKDVPLEDDEKWNKFLDQLKLINLVAVTSDSSGSPAIKAVNKPKSYNNDGPDGYKGNYQFGEKLDCTVYVNQSVLACTWSKELIALKGYYLAEDALFAGGSHIWAPGANLHRTPYSGRNFEYFSEDGVFGYHATAAEAAAMQKKGLICALKHFVANDQETNRNGVCTFMTEQALRQGPMKGFEGAFTVGGALSTMTSYNRIGCVDDCTSKALLTNVLRGEWGFKGFTITDAQTPTSDNMALAALDAGTDMWCLSTSAYTYYRNLLEAENAYAMNLIRQMNKRFYYTFLQSNLINGLGEGTVIQDQTPWWRTALTAFDITVGVLTLCSAAVFVAKAYLSRKKEEK